MSFLPLWLKIPSEFQPMFRILALKQDLYIDDDTVLLLNEIIEKIYKNIPYESKVYIPKCNTFTQSENLNKHAEEGDEAFEPANKPVNIIRSRAMAKQLHLTPEDARDVVNDSYFRDDIALFNYKHLDQFSDVERDDIERELVGEKEEILLTKETFHSELQNMNDWQKMHPPRDDVGILKFKQEWVRYLLALHLYKVRGGRSKEIPKQILMPPTVEISEEYAGFFGDFMWIPWKTYAPGSRPIIPWIAQKSEFIPPSDLDIYNPTLGYLQKGCELIEKMDRIVVQEMKTLEGQIGSVSKFYENEKITYSVRTSQKEKKEHEINNLMESYFKKLMKLEKLQKLQFQ